MLARIEALRVALGLSAGELLKLARENISEQAGHDDNVLLSIRHLRFDEQAELVALLNRMQCDRAELASLTSDLTLR